MRLTVRYESDDRENLVLRFTLSDKHVQSMTGNKLLDMFSKQFEKKFEDVTFVKSDHYMRPVGGKKVSDLDALISDYCNEEAEIYVLPNGMEPRVTGISDTNQNQSKSDNNSSSDKENQKISDSNSNTNSNGANVQCKSTPSSSACTTNGKVRCKNFGCNVMFNPNDPNDHNPDEPDHTPCLHHKSPPIFHETAKWWSCCPNIKAYDWDEFQRIPGCQRGKHSTIAAKKQVMGGVDLREGSCPQRIDEGAKMDPRKRLEGLRKGMIEVGVKEDFFDKAWGRLSAKHGNLESVCKIMTKACEEALEKAGSGQIDLSQCCAPDASETGDGLEDMD